MSKFVFSIVLFLSLSAFGQGLVIDCVTGNRIDQGVSADEMAQRKATWAAEQAAQEAQQQYPIPDSVVPMVNSNGIQVGTARILVDATTLQPVIVVNTASPQHPWSQQRADYIAAQSKHVAKLDTIKAHSSAAGGVKALSDVLNELIEALK